jgi:hypothetical protein
MLPIFSGNSSTEDNELSHKQNKCRKWAEGGTLRQSTLATNNSADGLLSKFIDCVGLCRMGASTVRN